MWHQLHQRTVMVPKCHKEGQHRRQEHQVMVHPRHGIAQQIFPASGRNAGWRQTAPLPAAQPSPGAVMVMPERLVRNDGDGLGI
jgi:hypothetical protein